MAKKVITTQIVLETIIRYKFQNEGRSPSYRELQEILDCSSTDLVHRRVQTLRLRDLLNPLDKPKSRHIDPKGGSIWLPLNEEFQEVLLDQLSASELLDLSMKVQALSRKLYRATEVAFNKPKQVIENVR